MADYSADQYQSASGGGNGGGPPKDTGGLAWIMFLLMGVGTLFPWNAILQAADFFVYQFPCQPIEFSLSIAYMTSVLGTMGGMLIFLQCCPKFPVVPPVAAGFALMGCAVLIYAVSGTSIGYIPAILTTTLSGVGDGLAQTGLYGMASSVAPRYTNAVMIGNGIAGVLVTVLRVSTKTVYNTTTVEGLIESVNLYFYIASGFLLVCVFCAIFVPRVPIVRYSREQKKRMIREAEAAKDSKAVTEGYAVDDNRRTMSENLLPDGGEEGNNGGGGGGGGGCVCWKVLCLMRNHAGMVFSIFFLTLAVYPGLILEIQPYNNTPAGFLQSGGWFPVFIVGTFNVGDFIGRFLPSCPALIIENTAVLWVLTAIRLACVPLVILMINQTIYSDAATFTLVGLMAVTNGYVSTVAMMLGPRELPENVREIGGSIMVFCLLIGLDLGSLTGTFINAVQNKFEQPVCNASAAHHLASQRFLENW